MNQRHQSINNFTQVVGRNVGRHADGDSGRTIDQKLGNSGRQNGGFLLGAVEVVNEIDGFGFNILQQRMSRQRGQTRLGVSHSSGRVIIHRPKVPVAINQRGTHGKVLGHPHEGIVNRLVAVGVIFTQHFPDDAGAFFKGSIVSQAQFMHRVENTTVNGFESIAGIR